MKTTQIATLIATLLIASQRNHCHRRKRRSQP